MPMSTEGTPAVSDTEHGISTQAYICPVCFDDHSTGPHRFTDEELAARDARLRAEIGEKIRRMSVFVYSLTTTGSTELRDRAASIAEGKP